MPEPYDYCHRCGGTGALPSSACPDCHGSGRIAVGEWRSHPIMDGGAWLEDGELGYWRECYKDQLARANAAEAENKRLRAGLRRIADSESGHWGWIAHEALHPERAKS